MAGFETYAKVDGTTFAHEMAVREREYLFLCFFNTYFNKSAAGRRAVSWERGQWLVRHWGGRKLFAWPVGGRSVDLYFCQEAWLFKRNVVDRGQLTSVHFLKCVLEVCGHLTLWQAGATFGRL